NSNKVSNIYIKSKLVPGVETLPSFLKILSPVFERFGGTTGGYAKDETSKVFQINNQLNVAPVICYESIYGEYLSTYIKKGANLITILTNDGWWGNTAGHKQHLAYAKLRAIETRCWIVRSANTGISAVINDYGLVLNTLDWNKEGAIKQTVQINNAKSFYVQHGDYLYFIFSIIAFILIGYFLFILLRKNKKTQ
ncbi:MAG TPA: apolipoprotein N-acyltransferase, partial [Chitinophagaceae bacterium]|nr:apolipoprotein N-acyltransferase [Chitinophagaceae bacterium]